MTHYFADWVLPISAPPIRNGWVAIEEGRIVAVGPRRAAGSPANACELGHTAVMPGVVNAHTHLELGYLRDAVPASRTFTDWVQQVMAKRRDFADPEDPAIITAAERGIDEARAAGTALMGEVTNTLVTVPLLADRRVPARVFFELLKFNPEDPAALVREARQRIDALVAHPDVRVAPAPHAPYSVSPLLFRALRADLDRHPFDRSSVHVAESDEEIDFLRSGAGPWRSILERLGVWDAGWAAPGTTPVGYLVDAGFFDERVIAVHGVRCTTRDLERLASLGVTLVSCPRSNRWVGAGYPDLEAFYASGVHVAFGTDSLASVEDLNVFAELAEARRITAGVSAGRLLESATFKGARALGFEADYGTIEPGKRAALIAVTVREGADDVEEYLVSGVTPDRIRWISDITADAGSPQSTISPKSAINPPSAIRHPPC